MTLRTVQNAVQKLQTMKAEMEERGLREMAAEKRDELRKRF